MGHTHTLCAGRKNVKEVETHEPPTVGSTTREGYPLLLAAAAIRLSDNSQNLASIDSSCFLIGVAVGYFHCWVTLGQVDSRGIAVGVQRHKYMEEPMGRRTRSRSCCSRMTPPEVRMLSRARRYPTCLYPSRSLVSISLVTKSLIRSSST